MDLTTPTIHLNGTSAEALTDDYSAAYRAVCAAIESLQAASPNARDYYVQGPGAFAKARREHEARLHKLADVAGDLMAILEVVVDSRKVVR